jgi:hypothetical protein
VKARFEIASVGSVRSSDWHAETGPSDQVRGPSRLCVRRNDQGR